MYKTMLDFLEEKLKEAEISHYRMAKILGVSQSTVSRWLDQTHPMPLKAYMRMLAYVGIEDVVFKNKNTETTLKIKSINQ
jgi:predicted transcriptional regulator